MSDFVDDIESMVGVWETCNEKREDEWKNGIHVDQNDTEYFIKDMTTQHLENTIRYFQRDGLDITPLEEEIKKRE